MHIKAFGNLIDRLTDPNKIDNQQHENAIKTARWVGVAMIVAGSAIAILGIVSLGTGFGGIGGCLAGLLAGASLITGGYELMTLASNVETVKAKRSLEGHTQQPKEIWKDLSKSTLVIGFVGNYLI